MNGDLISRSALLERLGKVMVRGDAFGMGVAFGVDHAKDVITEAPAVDAVEVVRCKDCIFREEPHIYGRSVIGELWCRVIGVPMNLDDFCSYGERRPDDAD